MARTTVNFPQSYYADFDTGRPLASAYIYIGEPDLDPEVGANQKDIFFVQEDGTEIAGIQPVRTSAGGVPTYNGSRVTVRVDGDYSIKVLNSESSQVYYSPNSNINDVESAAVLSVDSYDNLPAAEDNSGVTYHVDDVGHVKSDGAAWNPVEAVWKTTLAFGAEGGGVVDDYTAFNTAGDETDVVYIPYVAGGYEIGTPISGKTAPWLPSPALTWEEFSNGGNLDIYSGFDTDNGGHIWRFSDRVFVGDAAANFAGDNLSTDGGNSWLGQETVGVKDYPAYLGINAQLLSVTRNGKYAIVGASRNSDNTGSNEVIGVGSAPINDSAGGTAWGFIAELQHESGANQSYGIEVAAKNKGADLSLTPNAQTGGVFGVWLAGGGDPPFGGSSANPSNAGIVVLKNDNTWNRGLVFMRDALTDGEAISLSSEGDSSNSHFLRWYNAAGNSTFVIKGDTTSADEYAILRDNSGLCINGVGNNIACFVSSPTAVNSLNISSGITGQAPSIEATGSDTNVDLSFLTKGSGKIKFGTFVSSVLSINGYIEIKDSSGTLRKLAVVA